MGKFLDSESVSLSGWAKLSEGHVNESPFPLIPSFLGLWSAVLQGSGVLCHICVSLQHPSWLELKQLDCIAGLDWDTGSMHNHWSNGPAYCFDAEEWKQGPIFVPLCAGAVPEQVWIMSGWFPISWCHCLECSSETQLCELTFVNISSAWTSIMQNVVCMPLWIVAYFLQCL